MAERKPFDPSRIRVPAAERLSPSPDGTVTVREVNELVRRAIDRQVPSTLHVLGEVGNLSRPASGHVYFTLKDLTAELRCVMWRSAAARLKFEPEAGMEVIAIGGLEVYIPRGSYQLMVRKLEPRGVGALEVAFRQLKERLEKEGLFDPARKKPLPRIPERIAVVTSPSGAAIRDILQTLARRFPALEILVLPVRVQGEGAAAEIADAIRLVNRHATTLGGIDAAIVGRGGGSLEDLWAFNEEIVARAIAASRIPIISAVGHEVDVSISDLVADMRAATPTAAAEIVAPNRVELLEWVDTRAMRAARAIQHRLELSRAELYRLLAREPIDKPLRRSRDLAQLIDEMAQRAARAADDQLQAARKHVNKADLAILRFGSGAQFARLGQRLQQREHALQAGLVAAMRLAERRLEQRERRLHAVGPQRDLPRLDDHVRVARHRLDSAATRLIHYGRRLLAARLEAVRACDPKSVLKRGYSITREARTRKVLRSIEEIRDKMRVITELHDGEFRATADDPRQLDLFE